MMRIGPPTRRPRRELRSARRLVARPGPAAAHGHRSLSIRTLRRPPHRRRCIAVRGRARRLVVRPGPAAAHGHRSLALRALRCPPHRRRLVCGVTGGAANVPGAFGSGCPCPPVPPVPSMPVGQVVDVWFGASSRCQALPPPTGSAARPRWCSGRRRVRPPARLGDLTSFGAAPRSPARPSGPSGALHTCGVVVNDADRCVVSDVRPGPAAAHGRFGNPRRPCCCLHIGCVGDGCAQSADHFGEIE